MTARLVLHRGARPATRDEVARVATPDRTRSWVPIPHASLLDGVQTALERAGLRVTHESHGLAVENARLYADLRAADARKDEFLALLGHELRNPLAPIKNAVRILELKGDDPDAATRPRAMIYRQANQLTHLVDELLDASRMARGKVRLWVEPLDLAALVRTAIGDHRHEAEAAGLAVEVAVPAEPVRVRGDLARLTQVVTNLLHNAVKFTPKGGRVGVRLGVEGGEAVLSVSDTGCGIAPADLNTLFQAFRQVNADAARTKGGLGLGLAVVKGLVELHGGRVAAESAGADRGATFTVRLPLDMEIVGPSPAPTLGADSEGGGRGLVIIEDNADAAESLAELLNLVGCDARACYDGGAVLALADEFGPDVCILDVRMPVRDGWATARRLRAAGRCSSSH